MGGFKKDFPGIAEWVNGWGRIEIGQDKPSTSSVRLLDEGGLVWENSGHIKNLENALQAANEFVIMWITENS